MEISRAKNVSELVKSTRSMASKFQTWVSYHIRISMLVSVSFPRPKERPVNLLKNERIDSPPWTLLLPVVSRYFYPGCIRKSNKIKCDKVMYANFMTHPLAVYNGNPPDMVRSSGFPAYQKTEVIMNEQFSKPCWLMIVEGYVTQYGGLSWIIIERLPMNQSPQWTEHPKPMTCQW